MIIDNGNITYIYALVDPNDGAIRYIGKSDNLQLRYYNHICYSKTSYDHKSNWIKKLRANNQQPELIIVEKVLYSQWQEREKYWIDFYKLKGCDLTNSTNGGEGVNSFDALFIRGMQAKDSGKLLGAKSHHGKFLTSIVIRGHRNHIGSFDNELTASETYDIIMMYFYGRRFPLNFNKEHIYTTQYKVNFYRIRELKSIENYCWSNFFCSGYDFVENCKNPDFLDSKLKKQSFKYYKKIMCSIAKV